MPSSIRSIVVSINNICNMHCKQCAYCKPDEIIEMSVSDYKKILQYAEASNVKKIRYLGLAEPTLHSHFCDILRTNDHFPNFFYHIITNGSMLGRCEIRNALLAHPVDLLEVSIDAFSLHNYKYIRNGSYRSFQGIKNATIDIYERLHNSGKTKVAVSFVLHKESLHDVYAFVQFWKKRVDYVYLRRPHNFSNQAYGLPSQRRQHYTQQQCDFLKSKLYISADTRIHACAFDFDGNAVIGCIDDEDPINKAWNSSTRKDIEAAQLQGGNPLCCNCSCPTSFKLELEDNVFIL